MPRARDRGRLLHERIVLECSHHELGKVHTTHLLALTIGSPREPVTGDLSRLLWKKKNGVTSC